MTSESSRLDCCGTSYYGWICWDSVSLLMLQPGSRCLASSALYQSCSSYFYTVPGQAAATTSLLSERRCTEVAIKGNTCLIDCIQREDRLACAAWLQVALVHLRILFLCHDMHAIQVRLRRTLIVYRV